MTILHDSTPPPVRAARPPAPGCAEARVYPLLLKLINLPPDTPQRDSAREELVEMFLPLARVVARQFPPRQGAPLTFEQIAVAVLIQTVDRVDAQTAPTFISHLGSAIVTQLGAYERILSAAAQRQTLEVTGSLRRAVAQLRARGISGMTLERIARSAGVGLDLAVAALRSQRQFATEPQPVIPGSRPHTRRRVWRRRPDRRCAGAVRVDTELGSVGPRATRSIR